MPTANVVLNWADGKTEAHHLDKDLSTITVRSSDGFKFNLDVSQIIHIPRSDAPKVIARFGSMVNLVTQVLEPTIGNYFRNAAQNSDVIDFLKNRQTRQGEARKSISDALQEYNVGAVDTLIGDITPPDELMKTLTDRKIADQRKVTFDSQRLAEDNRQRTREIKSDGRHASQCCYRGTECLHRRVSQLTPRSSRRKVRPRSQDGECGSRRHSHPGDRRCRRRKTLAVVRPKLTSSN